jgi:hypothetical protein
LAEIYGLLNAKPTTELDATSILPSSNVKTARSWRGIIAFTHLARAQRPFFSMRKPRDYLREDAAYINVFGCAGS